MKKNSGKTALLSRATYDVLEEMARLKVQEFIQNVFYEEIAEFLRRGKSERGPQKTGGAKRPFYQLPDFYQIQDTIG